MINRRNILQGLACSSWMLSSKGALAENIIELDWDDLIPEGEDGTLLETLRGLSGVIEHGELTTGFDQQTAQAVTDVYNGKIVSLPGFIVPLDFEAMAISTFILAPFVGACIHVPPPPANQLVLVVSDVPYEYEGLYSPVIVTGEFATSASATDLAEIGYIMAAQDIVPFS